MPSAANPTQFDDGSTPVVDHVSSPVVDLVCNPVVVEEEGEKETEVSSANVEGLILSKSTSTKNVTAQEEKTEEGFDVASKYMEGSISKQSTTKNEILAPEVKQSWVRVVKKHNFTKQKFVVSEVEGQERVVVPKEVFIGAKPLWEDFLIGKFLSSKAPHVGKIHMIVNKIWRLGDKTSLIDVYEVNATTVKFRIRSEGMRHRVLNRGMWNIMDIPMIVSKWTPFAAETQPAMKSIPMWVTLSNIPPSMFTDKGLEFLSSAVGKPIRLHPKTETCVCFDEAQIFVEADLTKDLPKEYVFTGEEEGELDAVIKYSYPWLPPRCQCCKKWGHLSETCLAILPEGKNTQESPRSNTKTAAKNGDTVESAGTEIEEVEPSTTSQVMAATVVTSEDTTRLNKDERQGVQTVAGETIENTKEGESEIWITPSKFKSGRSPLKSQEGLKFGEVSILSNTYSALSDKDEMGEESKEDELRVVENEIDDIRDLREIETEECSAQLGTLGKSRKLTFPPRQSLPRESKSVHRYVSNLSTQPARDISRDRNNRSLPQHR